MQSIVQQRGTVSFPTFTGERVYMRPFFKHEGLPEHLSRWQPTVDAMLDGIDTDCPIYLMIDQKEVKANTTHRRPGMHLDGFWIPQLQAYSEPGHGIDPKSIPAELRALYESYMERGRHGHRISAGHRDNPGRHRQGPSEPRHQTGPGRHRGISTSAMWDTGPKWNDAHTETQWPNEGIILASNIAACRALEGEFDGEIGKGGDVTHLDLSHMREHILAANTVYAGNVTMLHESLPIHFDCQRTLVRLNVPGWTPSIH